MVALTSKVGDDGKVLAQTAVYFLGFGAYIAALLG